MYYTYFILFYFILLNFGEMDSDVLKMNDVIFFQKFFGILKKGHL